MDGALVAAGKHPAQHRAHQGEGHAGRNPESEREQDHAQRGQRDQDVAELALRSQVDDV